MEDLTNSIKQSDTYKNLRSNSFLWSLVKFLVNDVIIKLAKDLIDDGKLNNSVK